MKKQKYQNNMKQISLILNVTNQRKKEKKERTDERTKFNPESKIKIVKLNQLQCNGKYTRK